MEAKKKSSPSAAAAAGAGAGAGAAPPNGYFSSVFSSSPAGNAKDAKQTDLYAMLNKQSSRGQSGSSITDSKSNGRTVYKDGKQVYPTESSESPYFGSSVHYGGREFYSSSAPKQPANEAPRNYKEDNPEGSATRGDWWQGTKGVALAVVLELLILSRQASKIIVGSWRRDYVRPVGGGSI